MSTISTPLLSCISNGRGVDIEFVVFESGSSVKDAGGINGDGYTGA
jgi:hypothetical protein